MTPATIRAHLATLGWSQRGLADALQRDDRLIRRWLSGDAPIPADAAAWVERAARELPPLIQAVDEWHAKNPPPARNSG
jgi:hypothetical protein